MEIDRKSPEYRKILKQQIREQRKRYARRLAEAQIETEPRLETNTPIVQAGNVPIQTDRVERTEGYLAVRFADEGYTPEEVAGMLGIEVEEIPVRRKNA